MATEIFDDTSAAPRAGASPDASPDAASVRADRRRRALHAARAVTLGAAMAALPVLGGCYSASGPEGDAGPPLDESTDAGFDAAACEGDDAWNIEECCEAFGGFWSGGACAVPGPFVPPDVPV